MKLKFVKNQDHILDTKTMNFQMSNFNVFFQMVLVYYGITLRCLRPREQLLRNHKTQRHAGFFLKIPQLSWMKNCSRHADLFVCSPEPLQERYPHPKCENFNTSSQIFHSLLLGFFSFLAHMY